MPLLRLFNRQGPCPPEGFRYVDPVDGFVVHAWAWNDWIPLARAHLSANDRVIPDDLEDQMEDQLCRTLPPGWCQFDDPNRPRPSTQMSWGDVADGGKVVARWMAGGMQVVGKDEANRRALICTRCYLNVNVEGCGACHAAVDKLTASLSTKYDFALKACAACKCLLRAKVHVPIEKVLDTESERVQSMYPEHCWLNKNGPNYVG